MESKIEENFFDAFNKFSNEGIELQPQKKFETRVGQLRPDFVLSFDGYLIAFECDGSEFHDRFRDDVRDAILLGDNHIGTIYHISGSILTFSPDLAIKYISKLEPELFSERAIQILKQKEQISDFNGIPELECRRYSSRRDYGKRQHWRYIHEQFIKQRLKDIDDYKST